MRKSGGPDLRARRSNLVPRLADCFAPLAMTAQKQQARLAAGLCHVMMPAIVSTGASASTDGANATSAPR
jgi:hypothetical protein